MPLTQSTTGDRIQASSKQPQNLRDRIHRAGREKEGRGEEGMGSFGRGQGRGNGKQGQSKMREEWRLE